MSVFASLKREHQLFRRLVRRMQAAAHGDGPAAQRELQGAFLILLPALDRHEAVEDVVFLRPAPMTPEERRLAAEIKAQHRKMRSLRADLEDALSRVDALSGPTLRSIVMTLGQRLLLHFDDEELRLWPGLRALESRSIGHSLERRAAAAVADLERSVQETEVAVETYLGGRR